MRQAVNLTRTALQSTDLARAINDARDLIYSACWKLIRAEDIIVDEKPTLEKMQRLIEALRTYADKDLKELN